MNVILLRRLLKVWVGGLGWGGAWGVSSVVVGKPTSLEIIKPATGSYITQMSLSHQFQPCQKPPMTNHCRGPLKGIFMNWIHYFIPWCILYGVTSMFFQGGEQKEMNDNAGIESESSSLRVFVHLVWSNCKCFLVFCLMQIGVHAHVNENPHTGLWIRSSSSSCSVTTTFPTIT